MNHTESSHDPVYIVGKEDQAVLMAEEDYKSLVETLYINSIHGLRESILAASKEPTENFSEVLNWNDI